jgi:hypothetical protein
MKRRLVSLSLKSQQIDWYGLGLRGDQSADMELIETLTEESRMETRKPNELVRCPDCGAYLPIGATAHCWLCGWQAGRQPASPAPHTDGPGRWTASGPNRQAVILAVVFVVILLGVYQLAPGLAVFLAMLSIPIRLFWSGATHAGSRGRGSPAPSSIAPPEAPATVLGDVRSVIRALGIVVMIVILTVVSGVVALAMVCGFLVR